MQYEEIIKFFSEIEKNLQNNVNMKNRSTLTHNIEVIIYINMTSGKTHKASINFTDGVAIYSSTIMKFIREKFNVPNESYTTSFANTHYILKYRDEYDFSKDGRKITKNTELIRFIDANYITDMTYVIKFSEKK